MKVIFLSNALMHYRIPIWNLLGEKCDLTVAFSEGDCKAINSMNYKFKTIYLPLRKIGSRIVLQKANIRKLVKNYDVVIAVGDIAWLKYSTLPWFNKAKVIYHTIGVSASYNKGFDEHRGWDRVRKFFYSKASALAFYTDYPINKYKKMGIPREKMFVVANTVEVRPVTTKDEKDSILFIGTLYRQKGLQSLLDAYLELRDDKLLPKLRIIGKGPDLDYIKAWIEENKMNDLIEMMGAIYNIDEKANYFSKAYACISPKQAGLSVLESMGYGVPFVTSKYAITGGEIFNIHNGIEGVIIDDEKDLLEVIRDIARNKEKYVQMGKEAKKFYDDHRTPQQMADGFWKAIEYAYKS